ncbi:MAG: hypothetical protein ACKVVP_17465 [Chloroflexota bacterium]
MPVDLRILQSIDPDALPDAQLRPTLRLLLNIIEELVVSVELLEVENQQLRNEINRLKGEHGTPRIPPRKPPTGGGNVSSEQKRQEPRPWQKGAKKDQLTITRTERLMVDAANLPADAARAGIDTVVVQDLIFQVDMIAFKRDVWYSASEQRRIMAPLPAGDSGMGIGPHLKALAQALHFGANVTEAKLAELFRHAGVVVSHGFLAGLLAPEGAADDPFVTEARAVEQAGLASSP